MMENNLSLENNFFGEHQVFVHWLKMPDSEGISRLRPLLNSGRDSDIKGDFAPGSLSCSPFQIHGMMIKH